MLPGYSLSEYLYLAGDRRGVRSGDQQLVTSPRHSNTYNVGPTYVGNMESGNDEGPIGPRNSLGGYFKVGSNL